MASPQVSAPELTREDVLRRRVRVQQLGDEIVRGVDDVAILDLGAQDTGPDGAAWALALRGCPAGTQDPAALFWAWTVRGAPHAYRRAEAAQVAAAVAPYDEADAAKRVFDASRPLTAAGIPVLDALAAIADELRDLVRGPTVKGEMSRELTTRMPEPYLRWCNPCATTHLYEQPFRLASLQAGLELEPGTSPPVLRPIPGWSGPASSVPAHLDVIRAALHLLGPATPKLIAQYLDAPVRTVTAHWPEDVVGVDVDGVRLDLLAADVTDLDAHSDGCTPDAVRLLGPFDLFLQGRDRELVVPDEAARRDLWRTLGRPGGLLVGHEVVGTWRPRSSGRKLRLAVTRWDGRELPRGLAEQAERLATWRGQAFAGFVPD